MRDTERQRERDQKIANKTHCKQIIEHEISKNTKIHKNHRDLNEPTKLRCKQRFPQMHDDGCNFVCFTKRL